MSSNSISIKELRAKFQTPSFQSRPTPFYWWSGADLEIDRMKWHLDLLKEKGVGGTIVSYAHRPDGSVDHESPEPFSDEWWSLLKEFVEASSERDLSVGFCDYQVLGKVLLEAGSQTTGLASGSLSNNTELVSGPAKLSRPLDEDVVLSRRAVSSDGLKIIDVAIEKNGEIVWTLPEGDWFLSTVFLKPGRIFLSESKFDPLHPDAGRLVTEMYFGLFEQNLGSHLGKTFSIFFQDELDLGLITPMWNALVADSLENEGFETGDCLHLLWHGSTDLSMLFRAAFRDTVVELLQENFFKPIFEWHEERGTSLVMDQLSRGDLALGHKHYGDFMETMAWYQGPGNDDPDLTAPRNIPAFRTSASIAHLNGRRYVTNEAFHSSGWGVTPHMIISGLNTDFAAGANQVVLHGLDYSLESGWWEWASPDFHFRQPWWEHSTPMWKYLSRVSEMLQAGSFAAEIAILDPTSELDFFEGSQAPAFASKVVEHLSLRGLGVDLVPQSYIAETRFDHASGVSWISARKAEYSVVIVPNVTVIRSKTLLALLDFASQGGVVICLGAYPERTEERALASSRMSEWHLVTELSSLASKVHSLVSVDFKLSDASPNLLQSHRVVGGSEIYFVANPNEDSSTFEFSIRGSSPIEIWNAWSCETQPIHSEAIQDALGKTRRRFSITIKPGDSLLLVQSEDFVDVPNVDDQVSVETIDISKDWEIQLRSNLDNRYLDYSFEDKELPIASYRIYVSENKNGPWREALVDHGVRFLAAGPIAENAKVDFENQLLADLLTGSDFAPVDWRGYEMSFASGVAHDSYLEDRMTGPHGLKGVPAEFLDPKALDANAEPGTYYYFWSLVESTGEESVLQTCGRADHSVWVNGELKTQTSETPAGHFPPWGLRDMSSEVLQTPLTLKAGLNHVLTRVKVSAEQPSRVAAVISGRSANQLIKSKMKWWQGDNPAKRYFTTSAENQGWFKVQIPPGATRAFVPTKAQLTCLNGESVNSVPHGFEIDINGSIRDLVFQLTSTAAIDGVLDAGALTGPIRWECTKATSAATNWNDLGLQDFSGIAVYERTFSLPANKPTQIAVELTNLVGSARIYVNGQVVGICLEPNPEVQIAQAILPGKNTIVIECANTLVNLFSRLPSPYSIMQEPGGGFNRVVLKITEKRE